MIGTSTGSNEIIKMVTVGVITPAYAKNIDRLKLLLPTLNSVRRQSYPDLVHLVVDDGSPCDVESLLHEQHNHRIRYIRRERNPGDLETSSNALNLGIDSCLAQNRDIFTQSEANDLAAVVYLHSDDMLAHDSIKSRLANLGSGFVHTDMAAVKNDGKVVGINRWRGSEKDLLSKAKPPFNHHTVMWNIEFLRYLKDFVADRYGQTGVFDPSITCCEDLDGSLSTIEAAIAGGFDYRHLPIVSVCYRRHQNSISGEQTDTEHQAYRTRVSQKHSLPDIDNSKLAMTFDRLTSDLPSSLLTYLPENVKKELRPVRNWVERFVNERRYGGLMKELETSLHQLGAC